MTKAKMLSTEAEVTKPISVQDTEQHPLIGRNSSIGPPKVSGTAKPVQPVELVAFFLIKKTCELFKIKSVYKNKGNIF